MVSGNLGRFRFLAVKLFAFVILLSVFRPRYYWLVIAPRTETTMYQIKNPQVNANSNKLVLIACEYSAIVRDAFLSAGFNAYSCDIIPRIGDNRHICGDVLPVLHKFPWSLVIAFPPCTFLAKAGLHHCNKSLDRVRKQSQAVSFVKSIYYCPAPLVAIENPVGHLTKAFRPYDQLIHPYSFGDPYQKEICLWLKGLPPLLPTCMSPGRKSMSNHVNSRMSQEQKSKIKSRFFPGIADAMVSQWSCYVV